MFENGLSGSPLGVLILLFILVVIFLAVRAVMLWYWKIDTIVDLLTKQNQLLQAILKNQGKQVIPPGVTSELSIEEQSKLYDEKV